MQWKNGRASIMVGVWRFILWLKVIGSCFGWLALFYIPILRAGGGATEALIISEKSLKHTRCPGAMDDRVGKV